MRWQIEQLKKKAESINLKHKAKFFDSHDEYLEALQRNEIKDHHICLIDDVSEEDDDELIEKGYIKIYGR